MRNYIKSKFALSWHGILMCFLGTILYYYQYYLRVAPGGIHTELKLSYGLNEASFGFLVGLYYWAYVPLQIVVGIIIDLLGPRKTLAIACAISALGTYLFGCCDCLLLAQIGRFFVGFGAAFAYVGVLKLTNIWLPAKLFAFMAGFCSTLGMLGGISGQIIITRGANLFGWRNVVHISAIIGFVLSIILFLILKDHPDNLKKVDFLDLRLREQLKILIKDLIKVTKLPTLWLSGIVGCLAFAGLSVFADVWAISFLKLLGIKATTVGVYSSMIYIGFGLGAPWWGICSDLINNRKILLSFGLIIAALIFMLIIYVKLSLIYLSVLLFGLGFFLGVEILVFAVVNDICPKEISATAMGFVNMLIMLSGFYLQPKIGGIIDYFSNYPELQKYQLALTILPIGLVVAGILSWWLKSGNSVNCSR